MPQESPFADNRAKCRTAPALISSGVVLLMIYASTPLIWLWLRKNGLLTHEIEVVAGIVMWPIHWLMLTCPPVEDFYMAVAKGLGVW